MNSYRLKKVYDQIDTSRELVCAGCNRNEALSHSHTISRKKCNELGKSELIYDPENIELMCMSFGNVIGCHNIWEGGKIADKMKLLNFKKMMVYMAAHDLEGFTIKLIAVESENKELYLELLESTQKMTT